MIDVKNLSKSFGDHLVLDDISEHISPGEKVVVIGPSGSGKSTFLRCLNLLETPTKGTITFEGTVITDPKVKIDKVRQQMGMVFQHFNLFPNMPIRRNITLAPVRTGLMRQEEADGLAHQLSLHRGQGDVFADSHIGKEVEVLEHHAHLLADLVNLHLGVGDDRVFKGDSACSGGFQQVEAAQEGGLAGTGGADDHHLLPRGDVLGDVVQHQVVAEGFAQILNVDHFDAASFPACPGAR